MPMSGTCTEATGGEVGGAGGKQTRRDGGDRSTHLILIAGFVSQDSVDNRNVSVSEMSNVLMGQIDDLS